MTLGLRNLTKSSLVAALVALLGSCTTISNRLPASNAAIAYNPQHVKLLRTAAEHGVLFQIADSVLRDIPSRSAGDKCRKSGDAPWADKVFEVLGAMNADPSLFDKAHIVEFRRGDRADVEVNKDLDGATYLSVLYTKTESREQIRQLGDIPCAAQDMGLLGKEVTAVRFDWPAVERIAAVLREMPARPDVERLTFDRRFPIFLADQLSLFRLTPELAFEKAPDGSALLVQAFKKYADELAVTPQLPHVQYWAREISAKSKLGTSVKFFGLKKDNGMSRGIQVDSPGSFARKMSGTADPTYLYVSYRNENGGISMASLADLNSCLAKLSDVYRSPLALMTSYDLEPESFLYPGHHCQTEQQPN